MVIKAKFKINGNEYSLNARNYKEVKNQLIAKIFKNELSHCSSKTEAVINVATLLDVSEAHVWKVVGNGKHRG